MGDRGIRERIQMAKSKGRKKKKKQSMEDEFGYATFFCVDCNIEFDVSWYEIFELQEMTHGYVSFNLWDEYIACPKCGENANKSNNEFTERSKFNVEFGPETDSDLPF